MSRRRWESCDDDRPGQRPASSASTPRSTHVRASSGRRRSRHVRASASQSASASPARDALHELPEGREPRVVEHLHVSAVSAPAAWRARIQSQKKPATSCPKRRLES